MIKKPKKVVVIRHAEKPIRQGDQKLSSIGMKRAEDWARYIPHNFGTPDIIYATRASKESIRPIMTIMPLFEALEDVKIDVSYADEGAENLGKELAPNEVHSHDGQIIVVCWHHGKIPELLKGLGAKHHEYPDPWPEDDFGTALVVTFEQDEPTVTKFKM
jgi:hypothetical protein